MLFFVIEYLHVLGAIVILGTGAGIAFFMVMAHRSRDVALIAHTAAIVVIADMLFTLTAVLLQPVTGYMLMLLSSTEFTERWLQVSIGLYVVAGLFWVPVIFMQIEMRDLAREAAAKDWPLPLRYFALFRRWFLFGIPGFGSVMGILWLMIAKPGFDRMSGQQRILVFGASGLIGRFVTDDLRARGFHVVGIARKFSASQKAGRGGSGTARDVDRCGRAGAAAPRSCDRRRRQLPRRVAGRPRQRHQRRASRFR